MKSDSGNAADAALHAAVAEDCDTYPCKLAHAEFIRVVPSDGPQADAFPATMLTSQNGIVSFILAQSMGGLKLAITN
jgi:hypothetical protein